MRETVKLAIEGPDGDLLIYAEAFPLCLPEDTNVLIRPGPGPNFDDFIEAQISFYSIDNHDGIVEVLLNVDEIAIERFWKKQKHRFIPEGSNPTVWRLPERVDFSPNHSG